MGKSVFITIWSNEAYFHAGFLIIGDILFAAIMWERKQVPNGSTELKAEAD